jgi:hypothetical protein
VFRCNAEQLRNELWHIACTAFREWAVTGKTDLRLGRVPSRKVYEKLFADDGRKPDAPAE